MISPNLKAATRRSRLAILNSHPPGCTRSVREAHCVRGAQAGGAKARRGSSPRIFHLELWLFNFRQSFHFLSGNMEENERYEPAPRLERTTEWKCVRAAAHCTLGDWRRQAGQRDGGSSLLAPGYRSQNPQRAPPTQETSLLLGPFKRCLLGEKSRKRKESCSAPKLARPLLRRARRPLRRTLALPGPRQPKEPPNRSKAEAQTI